MQDNTNEEAIATTSSTIDNAFTASRIEDNDNHTTNVKGKYTKISLFDFLTAGGKSFFNTNIPLSLYK